MSASFWTLDRLAAALGGGPRGNRAVSRVVTDSRTLQAGDAFVALSGENFDGHDFLPEVVGRGAAALVVSKLRSEARLGVPTYHVPDTLTALGRIATFRRRAWGQALVAVAGSNGKTSTKDLITAALGSRLDVHATTGNLNNRIGVPLTLLSMPLNAEIAVVELGTSLPGEIAILRDIAEPDVAVVTCVAEEHLEGLGDLAGVLREESAVFDDVSLAIAPAAQPEVVAQARVRAKRTLSAGLEAGEMRAERWELSPDGRGSVTVDGVVTRPPLRGLHNLRNTMLALAVARECGISLDDAARGIEAMPVPKMRTAWHDIGRAVLINDAYNANPGSTRAALELLSGAAQGRQRVAVLGTMRELGPRSAEYHRELARAAVDSADVVAGVGEFADALADVRDARSTVVTAGDVGELWAALEPHLAADAVILLKASRGVRLERLVPQLEEWAARTA